MNNLTWSIQGGSEDSSDRGRDGQAGINGIGLNFLWHGTQLGVKRENETNYQYVDLKGLTGSQGIQGPQGIQGVIGATGLSGSDGKNLEFTWNGTQLGVRQQGQGNYVYVDLKGAKGDQGLKGDKGDQGIQGLPGNIDNLQIGGRNLIPYSDFESTTIANCYTRVNQGFLYLDTSIKYKGTQSLRIDFVNIVTADSGLQITYPKEVLTTYTMSGYVYCTVDQALKIRPLDYNWGSLGDKIINLVGKTWNYFTHTFTTKATVGQAGILILLNSASNTNSVYFDNLKVEKGNIDTDWSPAFDDKANLVHTHTKLDITDLDFTQIITSPTKPPGQVAGRVWIQTL